MDSSAVKAEDDQAGQVRYGYTSVQSMSNPSSLPLPSTYFLPGYASSSLQNAVVDSGSIQMTPVIPWSPFSATSASQSTEALNAFNNTPIPFNPAQILFVPSQMPQDQFEAQFPIPEELLRIPDGSSVVEDDAVLAENGRTYHGYKEGKYFLPNDPAEQDRLDFQHQMFVIALDGRLALAPMPSPPRVAMDVATGTGIWAIQFAEQNPSTRVVGTDLSAIQPENRPQNCEFFKTDAEDEWIFPHLPKFDYIHLRLTCISFSDPKLVLRHAWDNLNPGGWIEYHDMYPCAMSYDGSHEGTVMQQYWDLVRQGLSAQGRDPAATLQCKNWLIEAGFTGVQEITLDVPGNGWPKNRKLKRLGHYMYTDLYEGVRGAAWHLLRALGWSPEQVEDLVARFKKDSRDERYRVYYKMYVVYGRKPMNSSSA